MKKLIVLLAVILTVLLPVFGDPAEWIVSVAVDLETGKAVYAEGYPNLSHPDRVHLEEPP